MKKSSLISIAVHAFALILLSYNQNITNKTSRELTSQTKFEIVYDREEIGSPGSRRVEKVQNQKTETGIANINTSKENLLSDGIEFQSQSKIVPVPTKQTGGLLTSVQSANLARDLPKFTNVERKRISANSKESASTDHTGKDKYLWQNEALQPKETMTPELIQNGNHIRGGSSKYIKDTVEFAQPIIPKPKTIMVEKLSRPLPKPLRSKVATSKLAQARLTINDTGSKSFKNIEIGGSSDFSVAEKQILENAPPRPKIVMAHQSKNELKKVLSEEQQFPGEELNEIHANATEQNYNPPKTHKTFVDFSRPNVAKNMSLPKTPDHLRSLNLNKTSKPSNQARCKRTSTVVVPPAKQLKIFHYKKLLTINDVLGQPMNWNAVRQQVTISDLVRSDALDRKNKMGNVSISELLENNARINHIKKTVCIE